MATSIFFNGRRIVVPQAVTKLDTSALQAVSPAAVGIVALVGEAEGGEPLTVGLGNDITRPDAVRTQYRSGPLKTAALYAFEPSQDEAIPGGAQRVVPVKVNPATKSTAELLCDLGTPSVDLESRDWGLFTSQINIDVSDGTTKGKAIVVSFENVTESFDNVGGDPAFDVLYTPGANGYDTMLGQMLPTGFKADATVGKVGLTTERTADIPAPGPVRVSSGDAADTSQVVTVYGLDGSNNAVSESLALNGTTDVDGSQTFAKVLGATLSGAAVGTVVVSDQVLPTTLFSFAPGVLARGVELLANTPADGALTVSVDVNAPGIDVAVFGDTAAGAAIAERFDLTSAATTPITGSGNFGRLNVLALGDVAAARTVTVSATAVNAEAATYTTVERLVARLNAIGGFTASALAQNSSVLRQTDLDFTPTAVTLIGGAVEYFANLFAFIKAVNDGSQYLTATRAAGASATPVNTASPIFLAGGTEGTTTISEWQAAFTALKKRRVNIIVPLTRDPAVHSLLLSHLIERAGPLRSEANGYVGLGTADGAGETLTNVRSQLIALNSRHVSAVAQEYRREDVDSGELVWHPPYILAAVAAGMQAGSPIGEPLTRKLIRARDIRNDASWTVEDDIETLIDAGLMVAEQTDGIGIRWVRSVTTFTQTDNLIYSEMSANESADQAVFALRTRLDAKIGDRALASTASVIKGLAADELDRLVTDEIIAAWRPETLVVEQIGDVFPVAVEIAPVVPINFIPITVHLVPLSTAAA